MAPCSPLWWISIASLSVSSASDVGDVHGDVVTGGVNCKPQCQSINVAPCPPPPPPVDPCTNGNCHWDGTDPFCDGGCSGHTMQCGSESCSMSGSKAKCCSIPQQAEYHCRVSVTAMCGCGNNMVPLDCDDWTAGTCKAESDSKKCKLMLNAFQLKGGGHACSGGASDAKRAASPRWMLSIFLLGLCCFPGFCQVTIHGQVHGDVVSGGINCKVSCQTSSEYAQQNSQSSSDSSDGTSSDSQSSGEGTAGSGGKKTPPRVLRRLDAETKSSSKSKSSTMCGCGNQWMQVDCEMYQNKQCKVGNQQSQSKSDTGLQVGGGPKLGFDASQTVTKNNQACDKALKAFGDENRQQTCVGAAATHGARFVLMIGLTAVGWCLQI